MNTTEEENQFVSKEVYKNVIAELSREIEALKERYQKTFLNVVLSADGEGPPRLLFSDEDLKNKLQEKDKTIEDLQNKMTMLIQEHATERGRLLSEVHDLQIQLHAKNDSATELARQVQAKSEQADELTRQLHEKSTAVSDFEAQLRHVHEALHGVEERMKSVELERTELHQRVESLQRELSAKSARVTALSEVEARQCDVIDELQQQQQVLKREWELRGEELVKLNKTVEALKHDKQLLQESINTLQLTTHAASTALSKPDKTPSARESASTSHKAEDSSAATVVRTKADTAANTHAEAAPVTKSAATPLASPKRVTSTRTEAGPGPVVQFSGFKDKKYSEALKNSLTEFVVDVLQGQVHDSAEFSNQVTHVVTPPYTRTLKTLAAVLTCKWLVTPEWLIDAQRAHAINPTAPLLSPDKYGIRLQEAPLKDKTFAFHTSFSTGSQGVANMKNADILLKVGKGKRVKESEANIVLVGDELEGQKSNYYTWTQFMDLLILEHVPAILKEKPKRKIDKVSNPEAPKHKRAKPVNK